MNSGSRCCRPLPYRLATHSWCMRWDSNPHAFRQQCLGLLRLPFPSPTLVHRVGLEPTCFTATAFEAVMSAGSITYAGTPCRYRSGLAALKALCLSLSTYGAGCGSGNRTHVIQLMRLSWNHSSHSAICLARFPLLVPVLRLERRTFCLQGRRTAFVLHRHWH